MDKVSIRSIRGSGPGKGISTPLSVPDAVASVAMARFRRWRGSSGRSYLVSVYPLAECPDYADAILLTVDAQGAPVWVGETRGGGSTLRVVLATAEAAGASEAHLHLLAFSAADRFSVLQDLRAALGLASDRRVAEIEGGLFPDALEIGGQENLCGVPTTVSQKGQKIPIRIELRGRIEFARMVKGDAM
jgi:hypothetical protein